MDHKDLEELFEALRAESTAPVHDDTPVPMTPNPRYTTKIADQQGEKERLERWMLEATADRLMKKVNWDPGDEGFEVPYGITPSRSRK